MPEPDWGHATRWLSVVQLDPGRFGATPEMVRRALDSANLESRPVWKPLHMQPAKICCSCTRQENHGHTVCAFGPAQ